MTISNHDSIPFTRSTSILANKINCFVNRSLSKRLKCIKYA